MKNILERIKTEHGPALQGLSDYDRNLTFMSTEMTAADEIRVAQVAIATATEKALATLRQRTDLQIASLDVELKASDIRQRDKIWVKLIVHAGDRA